METLKKCNIFALFLCFCFYTSRSQVDVLTQHNDLARTGWNSQETTLNHSSVDSSSFGLRFILPVDDKIFAQPLIVSNIYIDSAGVPSTTRKNVLYVCTVNNTVYAYNADSNTVFWIKNFTPVGYRVPNTSDAHPSLCGGSYGDFPGNYAIVGTPVIDKAANTMYFVSKVVDTAGITIDNHSFNPSVTNEEYTYTTTGFHQYLHAISLYSGADTLGSPVDITAKAYGTGDGSINDSISFDPRRQFNRPGLVLSKGIVYIAFAAHCDWNPSHGWLLGYNSTNLRQQIVYASTPNDGRGGIWMSGGAPAVDALGNIYFTTGNGNSGGADGGGIVFTAPPSDSTNRGESVIKVTPNTLDNTATSVKVSSFFTPYNYANLNEYDVDFPVQTMLIPNTNHLLTGCKDQNLYILDTVNLGGYNANTDNVLQVLNIGNANGQEAEMHCSFAYFGGNNADKYIYVLSENSNLLALPIVSGKLGSIITNRNISTSGGGGGYMSVSSNGQDTTTGILWALSAQNGCDGSSSGCPGVLRAVSANNINKELWNSDLYASDNMGNFGKMVCPTIANGKVYVPTASQQIVVYGILQNPRCTAPNVAVGKSTYASSIESGGSYPPSNATDGSLTTRWSSQPSDPQWLLVDLGQQYNICNITINWETALGQDFSILVSPDSLNWTTVQSFVGNVLYKNSINNLNVKGQFVKMNGTKRGTSYGYSIYEMQVSGTPASAPLPVNLISFQASNINNDYAELKWATSSETGSQYYEVEKSSNGNTFNKIATVGAMGNTNIKQFYSYQDNSPFNGINYYRLKMVDMDGKYSYSAIASVVFNHGKQPYIWPNPANTYFNVIAGDEPLKEISLFDVSGKKITEMTNIIGASSLMLPISTLSAGIYILEIKTSKMVYQQKLLKE